MLKDGENATYFLRIPIIPNTALGSPPYRPQNAPIQKPATVEKTSTQSQNLNTTDVANRPSNDISTSDGQYLPENHHHTCTRTARN